MLELKPLVPKTERIALREPQRQGTYDPKQRRLMVIALAMLLVALGFVLYRNRDFWFPDAQDEEADSRSTAETVPASAAPATTTGSTATKGALPTTKGKRTGANAKTTTTAPASPAPSAPAGATATTNRTVLPPLEVEVVAGDTHRTVRPGSNSVRVDLQPGSPPSTSDAGLTGETQSAANVTTNASERVQMSADTAQVVSRPVNPGYPLLARQMKVQGSVILQALIGKDGIIQDLRVLSGPAILASAAEAAVRQWHFKPHLENNEPVETQAKITVNFTISTN